MIPEFKKRTPALGIMQNSAFASFVTAIHPVRSQVIDYINANSYTQKVKRGSFLLSPGEICNHVYLINKGLLRAFIVEDGKELTSWINNENQIVTSIRGLSGKRPSLEYIQALEDCTLTCASYDSLLYLYANFSEMNTVGRLLLEAYYIEAEERAYICRIPSAEKRYRHFIATRTELTNRVPLKYVASYLGMTVETISRIRGRKSI
jgi:CRP-like cAMP-binding protein